MQSPARKRIRNAVLLVLMLAGAGLGYEATRAFGTTAKEEVFSFDMWCLEMRLYPSARCDARRADDVKAYEQYRATVEQYGADKTAQEKRDQELQQRLNRDITGGKPATPAR